MELFELAADEEGRVSYDVVDSFLESLLLRAPDHVTPRAVEVVLRLLRDRYRGTEVWDRLLRISCVPGHPLNAGWLHSHLAALGVAERDASWSTWLVGSVDVDEESVRRLIDWAWPVDLQSREVVPDDVAALATQILGWLLTTSDRRVRDRATKAIVSVAERAPVGFAKALASFRGTNDPYVVERLAGAACGVVLRADDPDKTCAIADGITALIADGWPNHLLTRDFVRRVYEAATASGWSGLDGRPPYGASWPVPTRAIQEIEALAGPPDYAYGSVWHSLTGLGDFGRYVLETALDNVASEDQQALRHSAERAVFDRVLELGWTPVRFGEIDRRRSGGRDGVVERVGKKYQWVGFYEVLGRIADNLSIKRSWGDEAPRPYEYAEQLVWRDIDPTVLVRKPGRGSRPERLWFAPVIAAFPDSATDHYPTDMAGVPDPLDLMAVTDPGRTDWLVLVTNHHWEQPLPPEVVALEAPRLDVWMQLHAYVVSTGEAGGLAEWAKGKDWFGRWMPDIAEAHNVLLGSFPDDPEWEAAAGTVDWYEARAHGPQPAELWQCAAWYGGTGTSRDASAEEETRGYVPTRPLVDVLRLSKGVDFTWHDSSGLAVHDPSVVLGGPETLVMRRDLVPRLHEAGKTLFWTVLVGNELHRRDHMAPGDDYRWVSASASYILNGDRIEQVHALARRCRPGPATEYQIEWATRAAEP